MEQEPESLASQALSAIEKSRREMLCEAACKLLGWNLPVAEIMEITGLSQKDIEGLEPCR